MATDQLQSTIKQIHGLTFEEQLQLLKYLADRLAESQLKREPRYLVFGEFRNSGAGRMSTEEDFGIAQWNPTEEELNEFKVYRGRSRAHLVFGKQRETRGSCESDSR